MKVARLPALRTSHIYPPREDPWYSFLSGWVNTRVCEYIASQYCLFLFDTYNVKIKVYKQCFFLLWMSVKLAVWHWEKSTDWRVFENRVLGRVFWPKKKYDEAGGKCIMWSLWFMFFIVYYYDCQIREVEMGRRCSMHNENYVHSFDQKAWMEDL
jgi:hypothetical protein